MAKLRASSLSRSTLSTRVDDKGKLYVVRTLSAEQWQRERAALKATQEARQHGTDSPRMLPYRHMNNQPARAWVDARRWRQRDGLKGVATLIRQIQALPTTHALPCQFDEAVSTLWQKLCPRATQNHALIKLHQARREQLDALPTRFTHGDFHRGNILIPDSACRHGEQPNTEWILIDWEFCGRSHVLADASFFAFEEKLDDAKALRAEAYCTHSNTQWHAALSLCAELPLLWAKYEHQRTRNRAHKQRLARYLKNWRAKHEAIPPHWQLPAGAVHALEEP